MTAYITTNGLALREGDLVRVSKDDETHQGKLVAYNGRLFIGRHGSSLDFHARNGFWFERIEKREAPLLGRKALKRVTGFLDGHGFYSAAQTLRDQAGEPGAL